MALSPPKPNTTVVIDPEALIKEARRLRRRRWLVASSLAAFLIIASGLALMMTRHKGGSSTIATARSAAISIPNTPVAPFPTQPLVRQPPVVGIDVVGPGKLWLVDGYGLFFSSDWGNTWRYTRPPSPGDPIANFSAVSFINSQDGWLVTGTPKGLGVDHTVNGGTSWNSVPLPNVAPMGSIGASLSFANPSDGLITIEPYSSSDANTSVVVASTNGGSSWSIVNQKAPVGKVKFVSSSIGWGLSLNGTELYLTRDGGVSWQKVTLSLSQGSVASFKSLTLPTFFGQTGVLLTQPTSGNALLEITSNGGKTWNPLATPFRSQPIVTPGANSPICQTCVSVGAEPFSVLSPTTFVYWSGGTLYRTTNGGQSWTSVSTSPASAVIGTVGNQSASGPLQFSSPNSGWAITRSETLLLTRDAGVHFSSVIPPCHSFQAQSCQSMGLKSSP